MYERGIRGGGKRRVAREDTELGIHCLLRVITVVSILGKTWSNKDFFIHWRIILHNLFVPSTKQNQNFLSESRITDRLIPHPVLLLAYKLLECLSIILIKQ